MRFLCVACFVAPKPYDWLSHRVAPYVWRTTCYLDTVDGTGEASHPNVLDMFERARSAGLGGAVVLKQRSEEGNNSFVVGTSPASAHSPNLSPEPSDLWRVCARAGRIDRCRYDVSDPAIFGDRLEVRSVVELKFRKAGIVFHQSLWRAGGSRPLVDGTVSVYSIDKASKKPCPLPPDVEARLTPFLISPPA